MTRSDTANSGSGTLEEAVNLLADEYRVRCLWFLRPDYYPETLEERLRVLEYIQWHGDLSAFRRAGELRRCLLRISNERSAEEPAAA
ncbi:MAG: hypothetical protein ACK47B_26355 [Armatimonadota bacterium]